MKIVAGNANKALAEEIANHLGMPLTKSSTRSFSDKEIFFEALENVRGEDVFIIQPTSYPANDTLMELLISLDALKRASARRITAVIPYFGYARQDRKTTSRSPISAKLVANLITAAGANRVLTLDLHAGQIQGFFDIPVDNLFLVPVFTRYIKEKLSVHGELPKEIMVVSPDVGGVVRARAFAKKLNCGLAVIDKRREEAGKSEVMHIIGDVNGMECLMIDDIVDTAGTLCNAAAALKAAGAKTVSAYCSHGVLSGNALEKITNSELEKIVITDSIASKSMEDLAKCTKIERISVAPLLAEAIARINQERSVSSLFD